MMLMKSNKRYKPIYNEELGVDTVYDNLSKKQVPLNRQSVADELNKLWSQVQRFERENARLRRDNHGLKGSLEKYQYEEYKDMMNGW